MIANAARPRVGIMSLAHPHAESYTRILNESARVSVCVADPDARGGDSSRGPHAAERMGVAYVDSYEELLDWRPDAVVVTAENTRHRPLVELAASAGAHILCEKPLATTMEDAAAMRQAVQAAGVTLMVAFPVRFTSAFADLKMQYESGRLGRIVSAWGTNNGKLPASSPWFVDATLSGGGALVDHVVHVADLLDALTGAEPVSVTAISNRILHPSAPVETAGLVNVTYSDGSIATIDCSWSQPEVAQIGGGLVLNIAATKSLVMVDFFDQRVSGLDSVSGLPIEVPYGANPDEALIDAFLQAVRGGFQAQPDVNVGIRTLSIVCAAQESAATGRTVAVPRIV